MKDIEDIDKNKKIIKRVRKPRNRLSHSGLVC